eukprot:TRINITY_DN5533_c0_g1_i1.p1 TRINITY_DN5533_c0_g1~~TRINITY_DN5533_c0_g1_i1.p1  ORF type:complete len:1074 (-),score=198.79 TRINITY_DN5533_c0_g1_i1:19-3240(-)
MPYTLLLNTDINEDLVLKHGEYLPPIRVVVLDMLNNILSLDNEFQVMVSGNNIATNFFSVPKGKTKIDFRKMRIPVINNSDRYLQKSKVVINLLKNGSFLNNSKREIISTEVMFRVQGNVEQLLVCILSTEKYAQFDQFTSVLKTMPNNKIVLGVSVIDETENSINNEIKSIICSWNSNDVDARQDENSVIHLPHLPVDSDAVEYCETIFLPDLVFLKTLKVVVSPDVADRISIELIDSKSISLGDPFTLKISLSDSFQNFIPIKDVDSSEIRLSIEEKVDFVSGNPLYKEGFILVEDCIISSVERTGEHNLLVDFMGHRGSKVLNIFGGNPVSLIVKPAILKMKSGENIPDISIFVYDKWENLSSCLFKYTISSPLLQDKVVKLGTSSLLLRSLKTRFISEGRYDISVSVEPKTDDPELTEVVTVDILSNNVVSGILCTPLHSLSAGDNFFTTFAIETGDKKKIDFSELDISEFFMIECKPSVSHWSYEYDKSEDVIILRSRDSFKTAGEYQFVLSYIECRSEFLTLNLPHVSAYGKIVVSPLIPSSLLLSYQDDTPLRLNVVSNIESEVSRTLAQNCKIAFVDMFENYVPVPNQVIELSITPYHENEEIIQLPEIYPSHVQTDHHGNSNIKKLLVLPNKGIGKRNYQLIAKSLLDGKLVSSVPVDFLFLDEDERKHLARKYIYVSEQIKILQSQHVPLREEINALSTKFEEMDSDIREQLSRLNLGIIEKSELDQIIHKKEEELTSGVQESNISCRNSLVFDTRLKILVGQLDDIITYLKSNQVGVISLVFKCFYCDDPNIRNILSYILPHKLSIIVADQVAEDKLQEYINREFLQIQYEIEVINLEYIIPYKQRQEDHTESDYEIEDNILLPRCTRDININQMFGFVGFAINMYQVADELKWLRKTVLWSLISDTMIFDTYKNAREFREFVIKSSNACPVVVSLDGAMITNKGIKILFDLKSHPPVVINDKPLEEDSDNVIELRNDIFSLRQLKKKMKTAARTNRELQIKEETLHQFESDGGSELSRLKEIRSDIETNYNIERLFHKESKKRKRITEHDDNPPTKKRKLI